MTRILLIQGHPYPAGDRHGHALMRAYVEGATQGGHLVRQLSVASLDLSSDALDQQGCTPLQAAIADIEWAEHIVLFTPSWLGNTPAHLKHFLNNLPQQVEQPQTAFQSTVFRGRTVRAVVTTGMPALLYRWLFRSYTLRALHQYALQLVGGSAGHTQETLIGTPGLSQGSWTSRLRYMGRMAV